MVQEHRAKRCYACTCRDEDGSVSWVAKCEISERLVEFDLVARLQIEQVGRHKAVRYTIQTERKAIAVSGRRNGICAGDLFATLLFHHRHKLSRSKRQLLSTDDFKFKMMDLGRKFRLAE